MFTKSIAAALLATQLTGCSLMMFYNKPVITEKDFDHPVYSNHLVRMTANTGEHPDRTLDMGWAPYRDMYHWGPEAKRHRWVEAGGYNMHPGFYMIVAVPDQVLMVNKGDLLDVQVNNIADTNYDKGNMAIVVRIVCRKGDSSCMQAAKQGNGGELVGVLAGKPLDTSQLTFTPKFTTEGVLPQ